MAGRKGIRGPICEPRVQFLGIIKLLCPFCGNVGSYRITLGQHRITCINDECNRVMEFGYRLLIPSKARASGDLRIPPDYIFPVAEVGHWSPGERVHQLVMSQLDERDSDQP